MNLTFTKNIDKERVKTVVILILLPLSIILFFSHLMSSSSKQVQFENLITPHRNTVVETSSTYDQLNLFVSSLGVFSTILFAIFGYAAINSFNQQKQLDYYLREARATLDKAQTTQKTLDERTKSLTSSKIVNWNDLLTRFPMGKAIDESSLYSSNSERT